MNGVDILLIVIILMSAWSGYRAGFMYGMADLFTWIGSLVSALFLYTSLAAWLMKMFPGMGAWAPPLAFLLVLIFSRMILAALTARILSYTTKEAHQHISNKAAGVIPGIFSGLVWALITAALLLAIPITDGITKATRESLLANRMGNYIERMDAAFSPVFDEALGKTMNRLTVAPGSEKFVQLPFTVSDAPPRPDLETAMLEMVNEERAKENLPPLQPDETLKAVARKHSRDMFERSYFSHLSPEGNTPADRLRAGKVTFITSGENLALGKTLRISHNGLMNSPGHRANILHPSFGRVGIGILDGGKHGLMITQNFRN